MIMIVPANAFDKKQECFYNLSTKNINCNCESWWIVNAQYCEYYCSNSEGIWQQFNYNKKKWKKLSIEPVCLVNKVTGSVRQPCFIDKSEKICACKNKNGVWKNNVSKRWQILPLDNYKCHQSNAQAIGVVKNNEVITPALEKDKKHEQ